MADRSEDETCDQSSGTSGQASQENELEESKKEEPEESAREGAKREDNPKPTKGEKSFLKRALTVAGVGAVAAAAGVVAAPAIVGAALGAAGFTASGVVAGSAAAAVQSAVYGGYVAAGSTFALCQSAAATGVVSAGTAAVIGGATGASGVAAALGALRLSEIGNTSDIINLLVCGGSGDAHAVAGIASSKEGTNVRVLSLDRDEAKCWSAGVEVTLQWRGKEPTQISSKSLMVAKNPEDAMQDVDIVVFVLPASAHELYLEGLRPYIKPGTTIVGLPGHPGFEFQVLHVLGDTGRQCTVVNFESLPWTCRIHELVMKCEVFGSKESLFCAIKKGCQAPKTDPVPTLQYLLGPLPKLTVSEGHLLGVDLMCVNALLHTSIMYGQWEGWDGIPLNQEPFFYNGVTESTADLISSISDEIVNIAKLFELKTGADMTGVVHIYEWFLRCYPEDISDTTNLYAAIQTNAGYQGLKHPVKMTDDGKFVPDFTYRYLTEDIPYGLVVIRGIAEIVGIETPNIDRVLTWSQEKMSKEYLVNSKLQGKDVATSRAPQRYGFNTLEDMFYFFVC